MKKTATTLALLGLASAAHGQLMIDFNSTTQGGGPANEPGYQAYDAAHENAATFDTKTYSAFGTDVTLTPSWPNTTDSRVQQAIDRGGNFDANWVGNNINLLTDWLGTDSRPGNGGNGNWDGTTGTPTWLDLTLGSIPAGAYSWTSFHHDTEHMHSPFTVELNTGSGFTTIGNFQMTDSTPGGNPDSGGLVQTGDVFADPHDLPSTVNFNFNATGADVVVRITPLSQIAVHQQFVGINGFELAVVPEPSGALLGLFGLALALRRRR